MMGASVEVASLSAARSQMTTLAGPRESHTSGWFGKNVVVPMGSAHGPWIETFERRAAR